MSCISKISNAISYNCDTGGTGLVSALILNKEDIASIAFEPRNPSWLTGITLKEGATAYKIDTVKRALVATEALKINEGAPNAYTHSATVVITAAVAAVFLNYFINPIANGSFVILTKGLVPAGLSGVTYASRAYGLFYGMSATAVDRSSHDNGAWYTITMATPERVIGEAALALSDEVYDTLYAAAVG